MAQKSCCVPGCLMTAKDGVPVHKFPNPEREPEKLKSWISNIGGEITMLDDNYVYTNRRICHKHFEVIHKYPRNKLSKLAIPVLHMPALPQLGGPVPASLPEAILAEPAIPSTSGLQIYNETQPIPTKVTNRSRKAEKQIKKNTIQLKDVSMADYKKYKSIRKQLQKCEKIKWYFKRKYIIAKKMSKAAALNLISKQMSPTAKIFCQMQASQSGKNKKGRRFSLEEKKLALSLYKPSPKAYRLLSSMCVLPCRRTLQDLLHKIHLKAGINNILFENLKKFVKNLPEKHTYCALLFDEMAIGAGVSYNKRHDKITGFVDNGEKSETEYSDHVLVFMIRGVVKKYKQPLAYYYCQGTTKTIELKTQIKAIIKRVQETGLNIVATLCDQGTSNVAAINVLIKETRERLLRSGHEYKEGHFEVEGQKNYQFILFLIHLI